MSFNLLLNERYREILKMLYERHTEIEERKGRKQDKNKQRKENKKDKKNEDNKDKKIKNKKELYYLKTLAKKLDKTEQAISETVKTLIEMGVVKGKEGPGPYKGEVKYLDLTEDGLLIWNVLTLPTKDEIKTSIIAFKEHGKKLNPTAIAIELGKNPNDKSVMDLIYAVMAIPSVRNYERKIIRA